MSLMKTLRPFSVVFVLALAGPVLAQPVPLSDSELADVAAGFYTSRSRLVGEAIVIGNGAVAKVNSNASVALEADAQARVKAVALVNGADSSVANGSNVWNGRHPVPTDNAANSTVQSTVVQSTEILQENATGGQVVDWHLQGENRVRHHTETVESEFSGGIVPEEFTFIGSDTTETLQVSQGVAMAGDVDLESSGFGVIFSNSYENEITITTTTTVRWKFLFLSGSSTRSTNTSITEKGGVSGGVSVGPYSLQASGVICQTLFGSCQPFVGSHSESSHTVETTLYPARVRDASAGRIVMSDGNFQENIDSNVTLDGRAQSGAMVSHAVNAAGSQAANALNVSHGISATPLPRSMNFRQHNLITQRQ